MSIVLCIIWAMYHPHLTWVLMAFFNLIFTVQPFPPFRLTLIFPPTGFVCLISTCFVYLSFFTSIQIYVSHILMFPSWWIFIVYLALYRFAGKCINLFRSGAGWDVDIFVLFWGDKAQEQEQNGDQGDFHAWGSGSENGIGNSINLGR